MFTLNFPPASGMQEIELHMIVNKKTQVHNAKLILILLVYEFKIKFLQHRDSDETQNE